MRTRFTLVSLLLLLSSAALSPAAMADDSNWDVAANIDLQTRFFTQDARWPGQDSQTDAWSLALSAEFRWRNTDGDQRASIIPYLRWDAILSLIHISDPRDA